MKSLFKKNEPPFCTQMLKDSNALLSLLEEIYHIYTEQFAATLHKAIFNDTIFWNVENISVETYSGICLMGASKALTVYSAAVCLGNEVDSCWEVSVRRQ